MVEPRPDQNQAEFVFEEIDFIMKGDHDRRENCLLSNIDIIFFVKNVHLFSLYIKI